MKYLLKMCRERNYEISEQEIKELNEMSVLIYQGMQCKSCEVTGTSPTVDEAVDKTVALSDIWRRHLNGCVK